MSNEKKDCPNGDECNCEQLHWRVNKKLLPSGLAGMILLVDQRVLSSASADSLGNFLQGMAKLWFEADGVLTEEPAKSHLVLVTEKKATKEAQPLKNLDEHGLFKADIAVW